MTEIIRRILVPIDFSEQSERAMRYAAHFAHKLGARIELLHVVEDPFLSGAWSTEVYLLNPAQVLDQLVLDARKRLSDCARRLAAEGVHTQAAVLTGPPARMIVEHASTGEFDLIVMGTHGRTGLSHVFLGSVAERVLRVAPCAVLTVKSGIATARQGEGHLVTALACEPT